MVTVRLSVLYRRENNNHMSLLFIVCSQGSWIKKDKSPVMNNQQQQRPMMSLLMRRTNADDLTSRPRPKQNFGVGTKVSIVDYLFIGEDEEPTAVRLDGVIEGYEQVYDELYDEGATDEKYRSMYLVRFVHHGLPSETEDFYGQTSTPATTYSTFIKFLSEEEISVHLSKKNASYLIDKYFGRNLREMIEFRGKLVREHLQLLPATVDWNEFLSDLKRIPEMATKKFHLLDAERGYIGYFTVLSLAIVVLTVHQYHFDGNNDHGDNFGDAMVVKKLIEAHPEAVKQGRYRCRDDPDSHHVFDRLDYNKPLGILCFLLELDNDEVISSLYRSDGSEIDDNGSIYLIGDDEDNTGFDNIMNNINKEDDDEDNLVFGSSINPEILKILVTSEHGKYLATEFCPYIEDWMPIKRLFTGYTMTDEFCGDGELIDITTTVSPQARVILENNWQAVANYSIDVFGYMSLVNSIY